jgi:hypothetical protein
MPKSKPHGRADHEACPYLEAGQRVKISRRVGTQRVYACKATYGGLDVNEAQPLKES